MFTRFVSRGGKDAKVAKELSERCVWEVCCPRDTEGKKLADRIREFSEANPEGQLDSDQMMELAISVQAQLWGLPPGAGLQPHGDVRLRCQSGDAADGQGAVDGRELREGPSCGPAARAAEQPHRKGHGVPCPVRREHFVADCGVLPEGQDQI
mmetsp:Transcript_18353/g.45041  ORF Transcript_18353/g.45041 Transcript_18353/m.45041 type:complete len:153 (+) Transcript_18353:353-811(+)